MRAFVPIPNLGSVSHPNSATVRSRGPLLALVLPLLGGILARRFFLSADPGGVLPSGELPFLAAGLVLLFGLLTLLAHRPWAWWLGWLPGVFLLGLLHPGLPPPAPTDPAPGPPREEVRTLEPLQPFRHGGPSEQALGIGRLVTTGERVYYVSRPPDATGQRLRGGYAYPLVGVLRPLRDAVEDEAFADYLEANGVHLHFEGTGTLGRPRNDPAEPGGGGAGLPRPYLLSPVAALFDELRARAGAILAGESPGDGERGTAAGNIDPGAVYRGLVLGDRTALSPAAKELFRRTGTAHLFAISGLHIGLIAGFLVAVFSRLDQRVTLLCVGLLLLFYLLLVGSPPSAVRAFVMAILFGAAFLPGRRYNLLAAVAASAALVLLLVPNEVFSAGFQFSYTVVLVIVAFGLPLARRFRASYRHRDPLETPPLWSYQTFRDRVTDSTAISLAALLGSLPLTAQQFGILPLVALPLNLLLLLPVFGVLGAGLFSVVSGLLPLPEFLPPGFGLPFLLNAVALLLVRGMIVLVATGAELPAAYLTWNHATDLTGALALTGTIGVALWVADRPRFHPRYLLLPLAVLGAVLATGSLQALFS